MTKLGANAQRERDRAEFDERRRRELAAAMKRPDAPTYGAAADLATELGGAAELFALKELARLRGLRLIVRWNSSRPKRCSATRARR